MPAPDGPRRHQMPPPEGAPEIGAPDGLPDIDVPEKGGPVGVRIPVGAQPNELAPRATAVPPSDINSGGALGGEVAPESPSDILPRGA